MSKTYEILTSETIYKTVLIEAENEKEAEEKINTGLWGPEDVIDEDTSDFYIHETKEIDEEVAALWEHLYFYLVSWQLLE
jgi:hypothetical protein